MIWHEVAIDTVDVVQTNFEAVVEQYKFFLVAGFKVDDAHLAVAHMAFGGFKFYRNNLFLGGISLQFIVKIAANGLIGLLWMHKRFVLFSN